MSDTAALLRAYNAALHEARTTNQLTTADAVFRMRPTQNGALHSRAADVMFAHSLRVDGRGSPAECDAALAKALKEIGA